MLDGIQDRVHNWLADVPLGTSTSEVGEAFDLAFAGDEEISSWSRRTLAVGLWRKFLGKGRPSVARTGADGLDEQLRLDWYEITSLDEIDQIIKQRRGLVKGNVLALRDFRRVRQAMVAFPGVTAGEAARLAGVKLDVLSLPTGRAA